MSLSRYVVEKRIGKGQFSEVYRARDVTTNEMVAVKKIPVIRVSFELDKTIH
jgi:serine/threonine protein kinase